MSLLSFSPWVPSSFYPTLLRRSGVKTPLQAFLPSGCSLVAMYGWWESVLVPQFQIQQREPNCSFKNDEPQQCFQITRRHSYQDKAAVSLVTSRLVPFYPARMYLTSKRVHVQDNLLLPARVCLAIYSNIGTRRKHQLCMRQEQALARHQI